MSKESQIERMARRRFLTLAGVAGLLSWTWSGAIGNEIAPDISYVTYKERNKRDFATLLANQYGKCVDIDVWRNGHRPKMPANPQSTLVMGEFRIHEINDSINLASLPEKSSWHSQVGIEYISKEIAQLYKDLANNVPIILAADAYGVDSRYTKLLKAETDSGFDSRLKLMGFFLPAGLTIILDQIRHSVASRDEKNSNLSAGDLTRRKFLGLVTLWTTGVAIGGATKLTTRIESIKNTSKLSLDLSDLPQPEQEIFALHHPFNQWIFDVRENNMVLKEIAFSAYDFGPQIDTIQHSAAGGHTRIFDIANDLDAVARQSKNIISQSIHDHLALVAKYKENQELLALIRSSLAIDLSFYTPITIRLNRNIDPQLSFETLDEQLVNKKRCDGAFLIMCKAVRQALEKNPNLSSTQLHILEDAFYMALVTMQLDREFNQAGNFEFGPAGSKKFIDEEIQLFGLTLSFSKGLFVNREYR